TDGTIITLDNILLTNGASVNQSAYPSRDNLLNGALPSATLNGGAGFDTVDYFNSVAAISINLLTNTLSGGYAQGDTLISIENIKGSNNYNDILVGDNLNNYIEGWGGNDTITGNGGADHLHGGSGNDIIN